MPSLRSSQWIILFVALLILPAIALAWMAVLSVKDSESLLEKRYEQTLDEGAKSILDTLNRNMDSVIKSALNYSLNLRNLSQKHFNSLEQLKAPKPLKGIFIFQKGKLVYPFWSQNTDPIPHLAWSMDSNQFARFSAQVQGKSVMLPASPHLIHDQLAEIRQDFHKGNYHLVVEKINQYSNDLQRDSLDFEIHPSLWLLRYKALTALNNTDEALKSLYQSVDHFIHQPQLYPLEKVNFIFTEMFETSLAQKSLDKKDKDKLLQIQENLFFLIHQSQSLQEFKPLLENHIFPFVGVREIRVLKLNLQTCFVIPLPNEGEHSFIVALYDQNTLDSTLLQGILQENTRDIAFTLGTFDQPIKNFGDTEEREPYLSYELKKGHPFQELHIYRKPQTVIKEQAFHRSVLMYAILAFSLGTIILSVILAVRNVRNEKSVYQLKTNILSSITHELKTPLTSIRMFAETIEGGRFKTQEQAQKYASMITRESGRLQMLIDDILVYGRLENEIAVEKIKTQLTELLTELIQRLEPIAQGKQIELNLIAEIQAHVLGDKALLESLFQNLVDNALKYTPKSGQVEIRIFPEGSYIAVAVKDNGIGIPSKSLNQIFDPFYRVGDELTRKTKGSGIGLAIVQKAVQLHNAKIKVESKESEGSTFTVYFPRESDDAAHTRS